MKKILFSAILITLVSIGYAQKNFQPAFIIQNNGDTIRGFIDYRNWGKIPASFSFKSTYDSEPKIIKPEDVQEVNVNNEKYLSKYIDISIGTDILDDLPLENEIIIKKEKCFIQELIPGSKSLYYYQDNSIQQQYYIRQGDSVILLVYSKYIDKSGKVDVVRENKKYQAQLAFYLIDCESIQKQLEKTTYTNVSLIHLFNQYYICSNKEIPDQNILQKSKSKFGLIAGTTITTLDLNSSDISMGPITSPEYEKSVNFTFGTYYDLVLLRNRGKWSFYNELIWQGYECTAQYDTYVNENEYSKTTYTIGLNYLKLATMLRYKYPIKNAFIFSNLGMTNNCALPNGIENTREKITTFYGEETTKVIPIFNGVRKYEFGLTMGIGAKYNHFNIETRFEKGSGMSSNFAIKSTTFRYSLLLSYSF
jgi:hypothetical protein